MTLKQLCLNVAEDLKIPVYPVVFEDLEIDDSRLYLEKDYVAINTKHKDNEVEIIKSVTHEYRHIFQIFYVKFQSNKRAKLWEKQLQEIINSGSMNCDGSNYINQPLEIDAFAYTRYYFKKIKKIDIKCEIEGLDEYLDEYIRNNPDIFIIK